MKIENDMHTYQIYHMLYAKYKHMLGNEIESYLSHLYYKKRFKINEIANDLGCSTATASRLLKKYKIKTGINRTRFDPTRYGFGNITHVILTISECLRHGMNKKQIAANMGCSRRTIIRICKKYEINQNAASWKRFLKHL